MALPESYLSDPNVHYAPLTADGTKLSGSGSVTTNDGWVVTGDQLPATLIDSDNPKAPSNSGTLRASLSADGSSQLALHIVDFTPASGGGTAEIWINPGSYTGGENLLIYLWWITGGSQTQPTASDTYGKNNVMTSNVKGAWKDVDYTDATSNGNDGVDTNITIASDSPYGTGLKSFEFNGSSSVITITDDDALDFTSALTMEFWFKVDAATGTFQQFISKRSGTTYNYGIHVRPPSNTLVLQYYSGGFKQIQLNWTGNFSYDTWYHIIAEMEDTGDVQLDINVDGSSAVSGSQTGNLSANAIDLRFGSIGSEWLDGHMKAIILYDITLSDDEKTTRHNNQSSPGTFWSTGATVDGPFISSTLLTSFKVLQPSKEIQLMHLGEVA